MYSTPTRGFTFSRFSPTISRFMIHVQYHVHQQIVFSVENGKTEPWGPENCS